MASLLELEFEATDEDWIALMQRQAVTPALVSRVHKRNMRNCFIAGAIWVGVVGIVAERDSGLLARLWAVPVHRASGLTARIIADGVRVLVNAIVLLGVGMLMGLRFEQGVLAILAWLGITVLWGVVFASLFLTVALYWPSNNLADAIVLVNSLALFFCTGFVPLHQYPQWIQPVVEHQPLSYAIEAMRGLALGGPVFEPLLGTLLWSGGIAVACALPMVFGYRRASMRG